MRAFFENKRLILVLAVLALGALTVLAISLNKVPFREGQHFGLNGVTDFKLAPEEMDRVWVYVPLWKQIVFWGLAGLMIILIGLLLSPEIRKRLLRIFIRVAFTFWAIYFLIKRGIITPNLFGTSAAAPSQGATVPVPAFEPPQVSPTFSYLISFAFALIFLAVIWILYRGWKRYVA